MKFFKTVSLVTFVSLATACSEDEISFKNLDKQAISNYSNIVYATYDDAYLGAVALQEKVEAFLANPSQTGFDACKTAWLDARYYYNQSEAFRFYGGPIDGEEGVEGYLNAWPIDENYIDYTLGQPASGIINNSADYPTIDQALLLSLNENGSETNISTGYHAIEFLLWGQDFSQSGPGSRPYTDYVTGDNGTAQNQGRRAAYLRATVSLLVDHLKVVRDQWTDNSAYRNFLLENVKESVDLIFQGMGKLSKGELAGERMLVAAESHDQENEHSCFSDNTLNDLKLNFQGIKNVYFGTYTRRDGTVINGRSFSELGDKVNAVKSAAVAGAFEDVSAKLNAIPGPFDQAIVNHADHIVEAACGLSSLSDKLADILVDIKKKS